MEDAHEEVQVEVSAQAGDVNEACLVPPGVC